MAAIELLLERNRGAAKPFAQASWPKLCIVTCDDAGLTAQLESRLGLGPGDAVIARLPAGGGGLSLGLVQRIVAKAVYVDGCDEVLVLSHSSCALYQLPATKIVDALGRAKVPRSAVPMGLRELVGAAIDPREAVRQVADALRRCGFLPESLLVHLGHLDETSGRLELIEHGEQHKVARSADASSSVGGYTPGPAQLGEAHPPDVLPSLPGFNVQQLTAPAIPEVQVYERSDISVSLPDVTTVLTQAAQLPEAPAFTSASLLGSGETSMAPQVQLTSDALFRAPPRATLPPRPSRPDHRRPADKRRGPPPPPAQRAVTDEMPQIKQALAEAVQKIRVFMGNEIGKADRRQTLQNVMAALKNGSGSEELVKIALRPILEAGNARYRVIDEMILVKEELVRMTPVQAMAVLRSMVP